MTGGAREQHSNASITRACAIVTGDVNQAGGMNRANHALAAHLARLGTEVHVVAHECDEALASLANVTYHRVPKLAGSYTLSLPLLDRAGRRWAEHCAKLGGGAVVNGGNCGWGDVNWVHYVHAADACTSAAPASGQGFMRRTRASWLHNHFVRRETAVLRGARVLITNSQCTSRDVIERVGGVSEDRVRCVYLGVDPMTFRPPDEAERSSLRASFGWPDDRPQALFVGALGDARKGLDLLVRAWRELISSDGARWDVQLNIAGGGRDVEHWRREVETSNLNGVVRVLGFRRDVSDLLKASDLMVAPSRYEPYGLNVHEALCCGVPALTSRNAGVAERYPVEVGAELLIDDVEDVREICRRLRAWRAASERYRTLVAPAGQRLRQHTWDDMAREFVAAATGVPSAPRDSADRGGRREPEASARA